MRAASGLGRSRAASIAGTGALTSIDFEPLYSLAGFLVGMLVGMTGVGGGSLMTPILVLLFGFHPATAVGTDLLYASVTKTVGTVVHGHRKTVDWTIVRRLASGSVPAAALTLFILARSGSLHEHAISVLNLMLGAMLLLTGVAILFQRRIVEWAAPKLEGIPEERTARFTVILGAVLGVLVSVTSVGAGALGITFLMILYHRLPIARIAGSDIAHAVPLTLIAGIGHWFYGAVDFSLMLSLLAGSIPGIVIGSHIGSRSSDARLRPVLAVTLLIVGAKLSF